MCLAFMIPGGTAGRLSPSLDVPLSQEFFFFFPFFLERAEAVFGGLTEQALQSGIRWFNMSSSISDP